MLQSYAVHGMALSVLISELKTCTKVRSCLRYFSSGQLLQEVYNLAMQHICGSTVGQLLGLCAGEQAVFAESPRGIPRKSESRILIQIGLLHM